MLSLEKIESTLFPKLYESFLAGDDPLSNEQEWRNVFDYAWETEPGHCGYALIDRGECVGMIGMVFCNRWIGDEVKKFCNLHTWWVREDYRGRSLALLRPVLELNDYTITHFTPCDVVRAISRRLGFEDLNSQLKILLPFGGKRKKASDASITFDPQTIAEKLVPVDKKIYDDHQPYGVGHLLIQDGNNRCYVLYTHVVRHRLPYCHIHYVSDKDIFAYHERAVRFVLLRKHKAWFVAIDARLVDDIKFHSSFNFWAPAHGLYKSSELEPDQIDHLYSDVVFLKLTVLPDMTHEFRNMVRHLWPFRKHN